MKIEIRNWIISGVFFLSLGVIVHSGAAASSSESSEEDVSFEGGSREEQIRLAEAGDHHAQYSMGHMYFHGRGGFPQDYDKAYMWYKRAAGQGHRDAQVSLGVMFRDGLGMEQNTDMALHWLELAEKNGSSDAPWLIDAIRNPLSSEEREQKELDRIVELARAGDHRAQAWLGYVYFEGAETIKKDKVVSLAWLILALEGGFAEPTELESVTDLKNRVERWMSRKQRKQSEELAEEMKKTIKRN